MLSLIEKYYTPGTPLFATLTGHSRAVADKALRCARARQLDVDMKFLEEAALLHDIGIFRCNAPDIHCTGSEPYIRHGIIGGEILRREGLPKHARVCERHTGAGLTREDIIRQNLPLPPRDFLPETTEEKLICYADKFFSKTDPENREKPLDRVMKSMERHGADTLARFMELHRLFG